jgi:hypothetical protein
LIFIEFEHAIRIQIECFAEARGIKGRYVVENGDSSFGVKVPSGTFVRSVRSFVKSRAGLARRASQDQRFDKDET